MFLVAHNQNQFEQKGNLLGDISVQKSLPLLKTEGWGEGRLEAVQPEKNNISNLIADFEVMGPPLLPFLGTPAQIKLLVLSPEN